VWPKSHSTSCHRQHGCRQAFFAPTECRLSSVASGTDKCPDCAIPKGDFILSTTAGGRRLDCDQWTYQHLTVLDVRTSFLKTLCDLTPVIADVVKKDHTVEPYVAPDMLLAVLSSLARAPSSLRAKGSTSSLLSATMVHSSALRDAGIPQA